ncbi:MAG: hypothetical protein PGN37_20380 [Mycobacterium kyogaense]|uniref:hypothetical protein n=1 Tax=Mycobacterium kyogaense TaxID=2212479 RepID=UPI002FF7C613
MSNVKVTIEHNGVEYFAELMRVRSTTLGMEDHGIWTAFLQCEGSGTGVGVGGYSLDDKPVEIMGQRRRVGTAAGMDWVMQVVALLGCRDWEHVTGCPVYVPFAEPGHWGQRVKGIANVDTGKALIFDEFYEAWRNRSAEAVQS